MNSATLPLRAALALGITSSALVAAGNFTMAFVSVPSMLNTPVKIPIPALLTQWQQHYTMGKHLALPLVGVTLASYGWTLYQLGRDSLGGQLLIGGIGAMVAVPVFTLLWMEGPLGQPNTDLSNLNKEVNARNPVAVSEVEEKHVRSLCEHWAVMCTIRACFPLVASVLGIFAVV